jgi:carboxylate-amine ligase
LANDFKKNISEINRQLAKHDAMLLSSAAHPWMNPSTETKLWQHDSNEVYLAYDRIFNCKGHGWSNLQSTHINLPFYDDEEFSKLHTAIRFLLPIIPCLTASSPILNSKFTGYFDRRLYYYERNQSKIPLLTGKVIPERIYSKHGYQKYIYDKIAEAIEPFDTDNILKPVWLNSRGAIARFDRGAIEIRIIDIQECPAADMSVVVLIVQLLKLLVDGKWVTFEKQKSFETSNLQEIFHESVKDASKAQVSNLDYLKALGYEKSTSGGQIWKDLLAVVLDKFPNEMSAWSSTLQGMMAQGTLAERLVVAINEDYSRENLQLVYGKLAECLNQNKLFVP